MQYVYVRKTRWSVHTLIRNYFNTKNQCQNDDEIMMVDLFVGNQIIYDDNNEGPKWSKYSARVCIRQVLYMYIAFGQSSKTILEDKIIKK